jgi:hypothetical protein
MLGEYFTFFRKLYAVHVFTVYCCLLLLSAETLLIVSINNLITLSIMFQLRSQGSRAWLVKTREYYKG